MKRRLQGPSWHAGTRALDQRAGRGFARFAATWLLALLASLVATLASAAAADAPLEARNYKLAGDSERVRLVIQFDREPDIQYLLLRGPHRLVVDLPETVFLIEPAQLKSRGLITGVRYGAREDGSSRMMFTAKGPFAVERVDVIANEAEPGYRLVVDLTASSDAAFEAALADQAATTGSTAAPKSDRLKGPASDKPFTIVIDAGHGGVDTGAAGATGTLEKAITLAFAQELAARLAANGNYRVEMTRTVDEFLALDERVRRARAFEADLFISIHADTIRFKGIRGATVYTVSDKASDAEAQALADRENLADAIGGIKIEEDNPQVADILIDLIKRETHTFSIRFARSLVGELSNDKVELINNPLRSAGFRVLRAPDVPSVLLELGYLSNTSDEAQLNDPEWRARAIESITGAIAVFAEARAAGG
jgi:N-acetylmuramoyl-L-alanine amidase